VEDPAEVIAALRQAGFDATQGHSMCVVQPPADRPHLAAECAASLLAKIVYLPIYVEMPDDALEVMSRVVLEPALSASPAGQSDRATEEADDRTVRLGEFRNCLACRSGLELTRRPVGNSATREGS
jgi:hypothetical protein